MVKHKTNRNHSKNYNIISFEWEDIERYLEQIIDMQVDNIYNFHYPNKKSDRNYVIEKVLQLRKHLLVGNTYFIGALSNNKLYGFIWCYESSFLDEKRMNINSLYVCKDARNSGLGQLLMNEIVKISIVNNCDSIATHYASFNEGAGSFYKKHEFQPTRVEMVRKLDYEY